MHPSSAIRTLLSKTKVQKKKRIRKRPQLSSDWSLDKVTAAIGVIVLVSTGGKLSL